MVALGAALVAAAPPAGAGLELAADEEIWIERLYHYDVAGTVTASEVALVHELRAELSRWTVEITLDCERAIADAGEARDATARARVADETRDRVARLVSARATLIGSLERLFPTRSRAGHVADALRLLMQLYDEQGSAQARIDQLTADAPCALPEISGGGYYGYQRAAAGAALAQHFPKDPRRVAVQRELVEVYAELGWMDQSVRYLRALLCPGEGDARLEAQYGAIDDTLGQNVYGGSTVDYATCAPDAGFEPDEEVDAWLQLAEHEDSLPGRRAAAIKALERALVVPGAAPRAAAHWELGAALRRAGRLVDAVPHLDDAAALGFADGMTAELGHEATVALGDTLAALWRESSLPDPDAALALARIYFHAGRRRQPHVRAVYVELAAALRALGAFEQASSVQREIVDGWPEHPAAPAAAAGVVDIELERGDRDAADAARARLIARFGPGSAWQARHGAAGDVIVDDARLALARSRFVTARAAAARGAAADAAVLADAAAALGDVIDASGDPSRALEARYLLGHVLGFQGEHLAAARALREVVAALPVDAHHRDAAVTKMVAAYERAAERAIDAGAVAAPEPALAADTAEVALPEVIAELRAAYDVALAVVERPAERAELLLAAAKVDRGWGRLDAAEAALGQVLADACFTTWAATARDRLVAIVRARRGEAAAQAVIDDVAARGCLDTAKAVAARTRAAEELLTRARALVARGDHAGAAALLAREVAAVPADAPVHVELVVELGQAHERAGALDEALRVWDEALAQPALAASPRRLELLERRAAVLDRQLDAPRAAAAYLDVAAAAGGAKKGRGKAAGTLSARGEAAVWRAARLRELEHAWLDRGDEPGAVALYLRVARGGGERAAAAWLAAAAVARRAGQREALAAIVAEARKARVDRDASIVLEGELAAAADAAGDRKVALARWQAVVTLAGEHELTPAAADAYAAAVFGLADDAIVTDTTIRGFRWGANRAEDDARLAELTQRFEALSAPLRRLQYGTSRYAVAATVRLTDVSLGLIDAIVAAPPPEWLIAELKLDRGAGEYAEQMRKVLRGNLEWAASELTQALRAAARVPGGERWLHAAEDRLARIATWIPVAGGVRREAWVEDVE